MKKNEITIEIPEYLNGPICGCSLAAQGLWLRMRFVMASNDRRGYLSVAGCPATPEVICRRCGCAPDELHALLIELETAGVLEKDPQGTILDTKMVEAHKRHAQKSRAGKAGAEKRLQNVLKHKPKHKSSTRSPPADFVPNLRNNDFKSLTSRSCIPVSKDLRPNTKVTNTQVLDIYQEYPRKKAKKQALNAIRKAISKYGFDKMLAEVRKFRDQCKGKDLQYVPYPATWFNNARWEDDFVESSLFANGPYDPWETWKKARASRSLSEPAKLEDHLRIVREVGSAIPDEEELLYCFRRYLDEKDAKLVSQGHPVVWFKNAINKYRDMYKDYLDRKKAEAESEVEESCEGNGDNTVLESVEGLLNGIAQE